MKEQVVSRNDASYNANTGPSCANDAIKVHKAHLTTRLPVVCVWTSLESHR